MIESFGDKATRALFLGRDSKHLRVMPVDVVRHAQRRLDALNAAESLGDLRMPPGNHLHALSGDLKGFWSMRINRRWRIIFRWQDGAHEVCVVDYH